MRIRSLDSLRGVAALVVVFYHISLIPTPAYDTYIRLRPPTFQNPWSWLFSTPLRILVNGSGAVLIFFVLSGLVLALSFVGNDGQRYPVYIVKRVMRIWPTFAVAILISATLQYFVGTSPVKGVTFLLPGSWTTPPSWAVLANHLNLIFSQQNELDIPVWSLVHEMRISILFPLIVFCSFRVPTLAMFSAFTFLVLGYVAVWQRHSGFVTSFSWTTSYLFLFIAGAVIAGRLQAIRDRMKKISTPWKIASCMVALAALQFAQRETPNSLLALIPFLAANFGAVLIVALCTVESVATRLLETPLPTWLGKVSYSLYLIHVPIILAVFHLFPNGAYLQNAAVVLGLSFVSAEILWRLVERPSMNAGRFFAKLLGTARPDPRQLPRKVVGR